MLNPQPIYSADPKLETNAAAHPVRVVAAAGICGALPALDRKRHADLSHVVYVTLLLSRCCCALRMLYDVGCSCRVSSDGVTCVL